ncbi:unnamed protein product [Calypogeia fissa]
MASGSSSSSEEDEEHNAALRSVAIDSDAVLQFAMPSVQTSGRKSRASKFSSKRSAKSHDEDDYDDDDDGDDGTGGLKLYQTRVQDLLQKHLDKVFEESVVEVPVESENAAKSGNHVAEEDDETYDEEIRLFRSAPLGVSLKRSRPEHSQVGRLPPRYDSSDEESAHEKESRFQVAAIESSSIISEAEKAQKKALARFLAAEEASRRSEKAEAERVGQLRRERGEEWLPSIAKGNMSEVRHDTQLRKAMSSEGKIGVVANYKV